jgi:hypothetical protein
MDMRQVLLALVLASVALAPAARAQGMRGHTVRTWDYHGTQPDQGQIVSANVVVGPGVELTNFGWSNFLNVDLSDTRIQITAAQSQPFGYWEIVRFIDVHGTIPTFTGVTLDPATNWPGFNSTRIYFGVDHIDVHLSALHGQPGHQISLDVSFAPPPPAIYCTAKTNSQGCTPAIAFSGQASASGAGPFDVAVSQVINDKSILLFYGFDPDNAPFQGGTLCVQPPLHRTPIWNTGGNPGPDDCSGAASFDFNAHVQSGSDPSLVSGARVHAQYYYRDPADPYSVGLSDAIEFVIGP